MDMFDSNGELARQFAGVLNNFEKYNNGIEDVLKDFENQYGSIVYSYILLFFTQIEFSPDRAKEYWYDIQYHQIDISNRLGRDIGLRVSMCDYFTNIKPMYKNLLFIEADAILQKTTLALTDELTGLNNRRYFNQMLQKEIEYSKRYEHPFSLLLIDLDYFKEYNDKHGHNAGDNALIILSKCLIKNSRTIDHITRYGGDEFAIILPQTNKEEAITVGERLRLAIEKLSFPGETCLSKGRLTVSIGVATFPTDGPDGLEILKKADKALYRAKARKNHIHGWRPESRLFIRYPFFEKLLYRQHLGNGGFSVGDAMDISAGGLQFQAKESVDPGLTLDITIKHPKLVDSIDILATVIHLTKLHPSDDKYRMGISFKTEPDNSLKINELLNLVNSRN